MAFTFDRLDSGDLRVSVGADFSPEDAWRIHELVERTDTGTRIALDFRNVRDCHDFALSLLARDILGGRVIFQVQGLTQHQERVLSYFGVPPSGAHTQALDFDPI